MWLMKIVLFISLFNLLDSYAGPRNFGFNKIYKHIIQVESIELGLETPTPFPDPFDDDEMVARGM